MAISPINPTQAHRIAAISAVGSLAEDKLVLYRLTGHEELGRLPEFQAEVHSDLNLSDVDGGALLGENVTVRMELPDDETRYFNGYITRFEASGHLAEHDLYVYRVIFRPWLWFLTRTANCRIFQEKSADEIILEIFQDYGFSADVRNNLTATYPKLEYCVQYRETAFDFVSRLMETWGMYYYFEYADGSHKMVLVDNKSSHQAAPGYDTLPYYPKAPGTVRSRDHVNQIHQASEVQPGSYVHTAYDFTKARQDMKASEVNPKQHAQAGFEIFDYPSDHGKTTDVNTGDGAMLATVRHEAYTAKHQTYKGAGTARGLCVGCTLTLEGDPMEKGDYLISGIEHTLHNTEYSTSSEAAPEEDYTLEFDAILKDVQFRTPATTPKPTIMGPQTAIVCGKAGEEIDTDEHGRIKVKFHWDRFSNADENSSCWIRVGQSAAGKKWGSMFIPRIGHEVIVHFLDGDPERPIAAGNVYNSETKPPFDLPAKKTVVGFKTNSSKGGGGFNEISIDDEKDKELIFIHGQKDQDIRIENIARERIGNERHLVVKNKQFEQVEGEKHLIIKPGSGDYSGAGDLFEKIEGDKHQEVIKNFNLKIGDTLSVDVASDIHAKAGSNYALDAGSDVHIKAGSNIVIEAGTKITLKVGGNFVVLSSAGVDIKGTMVNINSGGSAGSGAGSSPEAPVAPQEPTEPEGQPGEVASISATAEQITASAASAVTVAAMQAIALANAALSGTPFVEQCPETPPQQQ